MTFYLAGVTTAETVTVFVDVVLGVAIHGLVVFCALSHYSALAARLRSTRPAGNRAFDLLPAICLVPLFRILGATTQVPGVDPPYWPLLAGIPAGVATIWGWRLVSAGAPTVHLPARSWIVQLGVVLTGLALGLAIYVSGPPPGAILETRAQVALFALGLALAGVLEELLFRGILQRLLSPVGKSYAVLAANVLFSASYLGSELGGHLPFVALAGLWFGWCAWQTRSVAGVCLAHSLMNVGGLMFWPQLLG